MSVTKRRFVREPVPVRIDELPQVLPDFRRRQTSFDSEIAKLSGHFGVNDILSRVDDPHARDWTKAVLVIARAADTQRLKNKFDLEHDGKNRAKGTLRVVTNMMAAGLDESPKAFKGVLAALAAMVIDTDGNPMRFHDRISQMGEAYRHLDGRHKA